MDLVDGLADRVQRGVEPEGEIRGRQVVSDRLGHAHQPQALLKKLVANFLRAVAANGDDGVDAQMLGIGDDLVRDVAHHFLSVFLSLVAEGVAAIGSAENRAAARQNPADPVEGELERFSGQMSPSKPSGMPMTFHLCLRMAALVAARITALRRGASPPPVAMPIQRMSDMGIRR